MVESTLHRPSAVMATFPPRESVLRQTLPRAAGLVRDLTLVLNQFDRVPGWVRDIPGVTPLIPERDWKDLGKFLPLANRTGWIVMFDDDILYPKDYVTRSMEEIRKIGSPEGTIFGHHGIVYTRPRFLTNPKQLLQVARAGHFRPGVFRTTIDFRQDVAVPWRVDQVGTGTVFARAEDLIPLEDVLGAERRADIRLASWAYRTGRSMICLPHPAGWLKDLGAPESIYKLHTRRFPRDLTDEIATFAFLRSELGPITDAAV